MDHKQPYLIAEITKSRQNAAIRFLMPDGSRLDVLVNRTDQNAVAFDYLTEKLKDGINL